MIWDGMLFTLGVMLVGVMITISIMLALIAVRVFTEWDYKRKKGGKYAERKKEKKG